MNKREVTRILSKLVNGQNAGYAGIYLSGRQILLDIAIIVIEDSVRVFMEHSRAEG